MNEDLLTWYWRRRPELITYPLYLAGRELQGYWENVFGRANLARVRLDAVRASRSVGLSDKLLTARKAEQIRKIQRSLSFVGGPELDLILVDVVCRLVSMEAFEKKVKWRKGSGVVVLRTALYRLALYYGLLGEKKRSF